MTGFRKFELFAKCDLANEKIKEERWYRELIGEIKRKL
jgi:hypothetical protein